RALLPGMVVFPLLYAAAGTSYHHDALWIMHFPPKPSENALNTMWAAQLIGWRYFLEPLLAVTPIVPVVVALRFARLQPIERTLALSVAATAVMMSVMPIFQLGNFGTSPRYSLVLLPGIALLTSRVVEPWFERERPRLGRLVAMALFGTWLATRQQ